MAVNFAEVHIIGANALADDLRAIGQVISQAAPVALDVAADIGVMVAKDLVAVDTGATRDSISKTDQSFRPGMASLSHLGTFGPSDHSISYGPETPYAPNLEFGDFNNAPQPFMFPSADMAGNALASSMIAMVSMAFNGGQGSGGGGFGGDIVRSGPVRNIFSSQRTFLYSSSKFLGDVSVFGGREIFGPTRAVMMSSARILGDIGAGSYIGQRISNRLTGRAVGRIQGYGTRSLSHSATYSGFPGGAGGHRVYSRVVGRASNIGFSGFGSLGRMF